MSVDKRELLLAGVRITIERLEQQIADLKAEYPEAASGATKRGRKAAQTTAKTPVKRGRRRVMSAEERAEVSARMKKYWANRRKGKA